MSYNSKYTGEQVEGFLDQIANGEIGGGIETETDPIFSASPAASITDAKKTEWDNKQDKITDLDDIRSGAEKGATALQSVPSEYVTESDLMWIKAEGEAGVRLKGTNGTATGNLAISAGDDKTASDGTLFTSAASGDHAVAFGFGNTCAGRSTLAQGLYNTVNGKDSVAFGQRNLVNGDQAFAAGQQNEVTTRLGVAIGYKNKATNTDSIAIGYQNTSGGSASVAMGDTCEANGTSATAMGYKTKATGAYSSTFGENTQATNEGEVAMGVYNKSTTSTDTSEQTAFSFGIGTSDTNRTNAFEIKKNGDVYIADKLLSAVATSGSYNDLSNKPTIPTAVSQLDNDAEYITHEDVAAVARTGSYNDLEDKPECIEKEVIGHTVVAHAQAIYDGSEVYAFPRSASGVEDDIIVTESNLKTINGQSILGSGDIEISGGASGAKKEVIYWDIWSGETITSMRPNVIYWILDLNNITIESFEEAAPEVESYDLFTAILALGNSAGSEISLTLPNYVLWANGTIPELDNGSTCELSISRISDGYGMYNYFAVLTPFKLV